MSDPCQIQPHIMIVDARFYQDIADFLVEGAVTALKAAGATYEHFTVPGALEIPAAIRLAASKTTARPFDAYIALGCVIRGETSHYDIVAGESARGLMDLALRESLCIGNGILTCENAAQARERADPSQKNKGRDAAQAALALWLLKDQFSGQGRGEGSGDDTGAK